MKKLVLIAAGVLFLIIVGLGTYISLLDWNQHKGRIAESVKNLTGKNVDFSGPISVSLWPSPTINAQEVKIYNPSGDYAQKPLAVVKKMTAKVTFSSLFGGDFDVSRVSFQEPEIVFEVADDGRINWQSDFKQSQEDEIKNMNISLDSVTLESAKLRLIYPKMKLDTELANLNAEIIAESVFGPYRIEGSYTKGENPEGFAISLGQLGENISTSINLAINYPTTKSFIRYDGTVYFRDSKVLGSVAFESEQPADFLAEMLDIKNVNPAYNQKLALTAAINTDTKKIDLTSVALKYGKTVGAGNMLIPLTTQGAYHPKIEMAFDMTDLDLDVPAQYVKNLLSGYADKKYQPLDLKFDLIGDVRAVKTVYKGENIRDFELSFDVVNNQILVRTLRCSALSDAKFSVNGNLGVDKNLLVYKGNANFETSEFSKLYAWLVGSPLKQAVSATYQKAVGNFGFDGNTQSLKIPSFALTLDNSKLNGRMELVLGKNFEIKANVDADSINFDNYISAIPEAELAKPFDERVRYVLSQLSFLSQANFDLTMKLGLGIWQGVSFENLDTQILAKGGQVDVVDLKLDNLAGASILLQGSLSEFDKQPKINVLQYDIAAKDFGDFLDKLKIQKPNVNFKDIKQVSSKGVLTWQDDLLVVKSQSMFEKYALNYDGNIDIATRPVNWDGVVDVKAPDFVKALNILNIPYTPRAFALGQLDVKASVKGNVDKCSFSDMTAQVGANVFKGKLDFDKTSGRLNLDVDGEVNRLEVEKFLPDVKLNGQQNFVNQSQGFAFLQKPILSAEKFDFSFLNKADVAANLKIGELIYQNLKFSNLSTKFSVLNSSVKVDNFDASYQEGSIKFNGALDNSVSPQIKGNLETQNVRLQRDSFGGKKYGIDKGGLSAKVNFSGPLVSLKEFAANLVAHADFDVKDVGVYGWNFSAIGKELATIQNAGGVQEFVSVNLQKGSSSFDNLAGKLDIQQGAFELKDCLFAGKEGDVKFSASGNIINWEAKFDFGVAWKNKSLWPIGYTFSGGMENPALSVDVSAVTDFFEEKQAQLEAEKKAREEKIAADLKQRMTAQVETSQKLKGVLSQQVFPYAENILKNMENQDVVKQVQQVVSQLKNLEGKLDEGLAFGVSPQISDDMIQKITQINENAEPLVLSLAQKLKDFEQQEASERLDKYQQNIQEAFLLYSPKIKVFEDSYAKFTPRLVLAKSSLILDDDGQIKSLKSQMYQINQDIEQAQSTMLEAYNQAKASQNMSEVNQIIAQLKDHGSFLADKQQQVDVLTKQILDLAENLVRQEEVVEAKRQLALERKRKVKEGTGTIGVDATGQVKTIVPDIAQIEKTEDDIRNARVKVLDFSQKNKVTRDDAPNSNIPQREKSGLLSEIGRDNISLSGTISQD